MVKVIGPCFSIQAQGNLANTLNYCTRNDVDLVRHKIDNFPTKTDELKVIQDFMRETVWTWQHMIDGTKELWNDWAKTYEPSMSGFNAFTSYYMTNLIAGQIPPIEP